MNEALAAKLQDAPAHLHPLELMKSYPRIAERIAQLWGSPDIEAYFQELMLDDRGDRQGFPESVLSEIFRLRTYYRSLLPLPTRTVDNWADFIGREEEASARQDQAGPP